MERVPSGRVSRSVIERIYTPARNGAGSSHSPRVVALDEMHPSRRPDLGEFRPNHSQRPPPVASGEISPHRQGPVAASATRGGDREKPGRVAVVGSRGRSRRRLPRVPPLGPGAPRVPRARHARSGAGRPAGLRLFDGPLHGRGTLRVRPIQLPDPVREPRPHLALHLVEHRGQPALDLERGSPRELGQERPGLLAAVGELPAALVEDLLAAEDAATPSTAGPTIAAPSSVPTQPEQLDAGLRPGHDPVAGASRDFVRPRTPGPPCQNSVDIERDRGPRRR